MVTVERISIGSAARVLALVYALLWAILGLIFLLLQSAFISLILGSLELSEQTSYSGGSLGSGAVFGAFSLVSLVCGYLVGIVAAGLAGAVSGIIIALCYNWTARLVGGVELRISTTGFTLGAAAQSTRSLEDELLAG